MAMVRVMARLLSGYCLHLPDVFTGTHRCISSLRPHPVVAGVRADLASVQFSCSVVLAIICTASSGGSLVFKQRVMDGGGGFQAPSVDSSVPKDSMPSQVAV